MSSTLRKTALMALVAGTSAASPLLAQAGCDVQSGARTTALVELYTSEGCSSCPPADRQLNALRQTLDGGARVVPLALHVDYWDYIGWKDPFAQAGFDVRQRWLVQANDRRTVYTPQFFVSGSEQRSWPGGLRDEVRRVNDRPAAADLKLHAMPAPSGATLQVRADARVHDAAEPAQLYLALAESGLVSHVARGENGGTTLAHDHVVRQWIGPIALAQGSAHAEREIALPSGWDRSRLTLVAFVQDARSGKVLQALAAPQCAAGS